MQSTRITTLVSMLLALAAVVWGALRIAETRGATLPTLAWSAPALVVLLAVVVLVTVIALRSRLRAGRRPDPLGMARMVVLGKASAHVGPIVGGFYLGYLLLLVPRLEVVDRRERALLCLGALLACVLLSAAGLLLERTCRVRGGDDDDVPAAPA